MVGVAYHAGVLHALHEVGGFHANDADLVVGTSAGSVAGAYLRSGWSPADLWHLAQGTHPDLRALGGDGLGRGGAVGPLFRWASALALFDLVGRPRGWTFLLP